jgi:hypothetical protein
MTADLRKAAIRKSLRRTIADQPHVAPDNNVL